MARQPPDDLVELGCITTPHGVKGWVRVRSYSAAAVVLCDAASWWLKAPALAIGQGEWPRLSAVRVLACRPHGAGFIANLDGVRDRSRAESLRGFRICVSRAAFPATGADEYYWVDLIGCELWGVRDGAPVLIGNVTEVIDNGAHALLRVARSTGRDAEEHRSPTRSTTVDVPDALVPFVGAHVQRVDLAARRIDSNWPVDF